MPSKVDASVLAMEMDRRKMVLAASESASDKCVPQQCDLVGASGLNIRLWYGVCLVFGSDNRQSFINWIEVVIDVVKTMALHYLIY